MTQEECLKLAGPGVEDLLFAEGWDEAIIGVTKLITGVTVVTYDVDTILDTLVAQGLSEEEAQEHFHFNIAGAYVGEQTPLFVMSHFFDEQLAAVRSKVKA